MSGTDLYENLLKATDNTNYITNEKIIQVKFSLIFKKNMDYLSISSLYSKLFINSINSSMGSGFEK